MVVFAEWLLRAEFVVNSRAFIAALYILTLTIINLTIYGTQIFDVNLIFKAVNVGLLLILFLAPVFILDYSCEPVVRWGLLFAFILCSAAVVLGDMNLFPSIVKNPVIHNTLIEDLRPRGLTKESSLLSLQVMTLGLLAFHFSKHTWSRAVIAVASVSLLIYAGSKGGFLTFLVTIFLLTLRTRFNWRTFAFYAGAFLPAGFLAYQRAMEQTTSDILTETTTAATRASASVCAVLTILKNPFGVGLGSSLPAMLSNLPTAMDMIRVQSPIPLNFSEVQGYLYSATNSGTKTMLLEFGVMFGVPFLILFGYWSFRLIREANRSGLTVLSIALICTLIAASTYVDGLILYNVPLVFGITLHEVRKIKDIDRNLGE